MKRQTTNVISMVCGLVGLIGGACGPVVSAQSPAPAASAAAFSDLPADAPSASIGGASSNASVPGMAEGVKAFDAGHYSEARAAFEAAAKKHPGDGVVLYNLGLACEKLGDKSAAERAYKGALTAKPDLETAAAELSALYSDQGRVDEALAVARTGLEKHPNSAPLHENLGVALASRGDQEAALKELHAATQASPDDSMMHLTLGHWLITWRAAGAAGELDEALRLSKNDYATLASVGHEYRMAGEYSACIRTFDHAIELRDGGEVRTDRALCRHGRKDDKGAREDLEAAVSTEPTYAPAHFYLGGRLALAKDFKRAASEYAKYLQLAPDGSLARAAGERMKAAQQAAKGRNP